MNTIAKTKLIILSVLPAMIAGCATTNPKAAFDDINKTVVERTGQPVGWNGATNVQGMAAIEPLLHTNLTVQTCVAIALLNNRSLQAEFAEIGVSQAELAQATRLHNIELAGSWRVPNRPPSIVDAEYSVTGDLLDLLTLPARKNVAARNLSQTKLEVADKVLQLAADTQTQFYKLQAQMELAAKLKTIAEVNDAAADVAQRLYDAGNINELELNNQQAPAIQSRLDVMEAAAQVNMEREALNRLLGLSDKQINWQIAGTLPLPPEKDLPLENLENVAVNQRLDLAAARSRKESIAAALRLKKETRFIPGVKLGVDTEKSPDGQRVTGPTLDLELPLFDQGQPAVAKLSAEWQQAQDAYAAQEVNVRSQVREAHNDLDAARSAIELIQKHLLPLRQRILGETLLQYNAMQKNSFDLLASKEREQNAEQARITALRNYWIASVELERAVGGRFGYAVNASAPPATESESTMQPMSMEPQH